MCKQNYSEVAQDMLKSKFDGMAIESIRGIYDARDNNLDLIGLFAEVNDDGDTSAYIVDVGDFGVLKNMVRIKHYAGMSNNQVRRMFGVPTVRVKACNI